MSTLRAAPPRPRPTRVAPSYPRVIAVVAVMLAGCSLAPDELGSSVREPDLAGGIAAPFDAEPPADAAPDAKPAHEDAAPSDAGPPDASSDTFPAPDGFMPFPFEDAGPVPDAELEPETQ